LRSLSAGGTEALVRLPSISGEPQLAQNRSPARTAEPQPEHAAGSAVPQLWQNRSPARQAASQPGQAVTTEAKRTPGARVNGLPLVPASKIWSCRLGVSRIW
jgi:hypothetical protein